MAILECEEIGSGRGGSWSRQGRRSVFTTERTWKVITDDKEISWLEIIIAANRINFTDGLPLVGDTYVTDREGLPVLFCTGLAPRQDGDDPYIWTVAVPYSSDFETEQVGSSQGTNTGTPGGFGSGAGARDLVPDPLKMPIKISFSTRQRKVMRERDFSKKPAGGWAAIVAGALDPQGIFDGTGRAFVNSAGELFANGVEDDEYNQVFTIRRNVRTFDRVQQWTYSGCVNELAWAGYLPRAVRITQWSGDPQEQTGLFFFEEIMEFEAQWPNWDWEILNAGSYGFKRNATTGHTTGERDPVDQNSGLAVNGMLLLSSTGALLPRTYSVAAVAVGAQVVTPLSMKNIFTGDVLLVGTDADEEEVTVTAHNATTFTATFAQAHAAGVQINGKPTYKRFQRRQVDFKKLKLAI